jgi:hypothetical protein
MPFFFLLSPPVYFGSGVGSEIKFLNATFVNNLIFIFLELDLGVLNIG